MKLLHEMGQDTSNLNLLLDKLTTTDFSQMDKPELTRQNSEKTDLRERLQSALEEKDDLRKCKVCFENLMDCVIQTCGHLSVCMKCGEDMKKKGIPCPICRKKITTSMRIFWT